MYCVDYNTRIDEFAVYREKQDFIRPAYAKVKATNLVAIFFLEIRVQIAQISSDTSPLLRSIICYIGLYVLFSICTRKKTALPAANSCYRLLKE